MLCLMALSRVLLMYDVVKVGSFPPYHISFNKGWASETKEYAVMKPCSIFRVVPCRLLSNGYKLVIFQGYVLPITCVQQGYPITYTTLHLI